MSNTKANILRIIFWGVITVLLLASGIYGLIYNNEIFSSRENELKNIVSVFNNATMIKNYENVGTRINANLKGKNILITYDGSVQKEYSYKLKNGYLETSVEQNDTIGKMILMVLSDSIAVTKGQNEGDIYPLFNDNTIVSYKLSNGIEYRLKNNTYTVKINLDKYILKRYDNNDETLDEIIDNEENDN